jgi:dienelactone hydrolase
MTPNEETLSLTSSDGKKLAATLTLPGSATCRPAILLVHQYQQNQSQWGNFAHSLAARGFVVLALDLRGHGMSDPQDGALSELLSDPDQAPLDVRAGVDALAAHAAVEVEHLAIFGTSIGANLAVAAQHSDERVRRSVALSPRLDPTLSLAGSPPSITPHDIYCVAGELDGGGDQAQSCDALSEAASGSAQSVVLAGSSAHGVTIFSEFPDQVENAVQWLEGLSD